jgi:hypothetical protein
MQAAKHKVGRAPRSGDVIRAWLQMAQQRPMPSHPVIQPALRGRAAVLQRMFAPRQQQLNTAEFERKHVIVNTTGNPFDSLGNAVRACRARLLTTTHNRREGRVSAATYFILTANQRDAFRNGVSQTFNGHAFSYAVTVDGADTVSLLGPGTFDVDTALLNRNSIDHLVDGGYRGTAIACTEVPDTYLVSNTRVYTADYVGDRERPVAVNVTCFIDKIGSPISGLQRAEIYTHDHRTLGDLIRAGIALYVEESKIGAKHDYFVTPLFYFW